jgi:AcrR family transcriptional regulator
MARPTRQDAEVERTRAHILRAAARAFARTGYRATTMAAIAEEAGYTTPTLYSYFRGKQDIFSALSESVESEFFALFEAPEPAGLSFRQRVELLLTRQFELVDRRRDVFTFFLSVMMTGDGPPKPPEKHDAYQDRLTEWLRNAAADAADPPAEPPEIVATMMHGLGHALLADWLSNDSDGSAVDLMPLLSRLLFHGCSGAPD